MWIVAARSAGACKATLVRAIRLVEWAATHHFIGRNIRAFALRTFSGDDEMAERFPEHLIETINRLVRTSRQMLQQIGRAPTPEELAEKLAMPIERVRKLLAIARTPISLGTAIREENSRRG